MLRVRIVRTRLSPFSISALCWHIHTRSSSTTSSSSTSLVAIEIIEGPADAVRLPRPLSFSRYLLTRRCIVAAQGAWHIYGCRRMRVLPSTSCCFSHDWNDFVQSPVYLMYSDNRRHINRCFPFNNWYCEAIGNNMLVGSRNMEARVHNYYYCVHGRARDVN